MDVTAADTAPDGAAALEQVMQQGETAAEAAAAAAAALAAPAAAGWLQPLEQGQQEPMEAGRPMKKKPNKRAPAPAAPAAAPAAAMAAAAPAVAAWLQPLSEATWNGSLRGGENTRLTAAQRRGRAKATRKAQAAAKQSTSAD